MFLELSHVFSQIKNKGGMWVLCNFLIVPTLVAIMLVFAYIGRDTPSDHRTSFVYFATLYAFWCGLFGSCQAFNGETSSGEWSYWMLGQRRSVIPHFFAHFVIDCCSAVLQVAVCAVMIWVLSLILPEFQGDGNSLGRKIFAIFTQDGEYGLPGYWAFLNQDSSIRTYILLRATRFFIYGLFLASISGTALGLLIGSLFRSPQTSLSVAVCLIVACTVLSQTSLKGDTNSNSKTKEFAPVCLKMKQRHPVCNDNNVLQEPKSISKDGRIVELVSCVLPQRFFFNLGRLTFLELDASLDSDWDDEERLYEHTKNPTKCMCPACLGIIKVESIPYIDSYGDTNYTYKVKSGENTFDFNKHWVSCISDAPTKWNNYFEDYVSEDDTNFDKRSRALLTKKYADIASLQSLYSKMAIGEIIVLFAQIVIAVVVSIICLSRKDVYHALR